jgi:hypothetical protein
LAALAAIGAAVQAAKARREASVSADATTSGWSAGRAATVVRQPSDLSQPSMVRTHGASGSVACRPAVELPHRHDSEPTANTTSEILRIERMATDRGNEAAARRSIGRGENEGGEKAGERDAKLGRAD